jgi:hypothetical protein
MVGKLSTAGGPAAWWLSGPVNNDKTAKDVALVRVLYTLYQQTHRPESRGVFQILPNVDVRLGKA